MLEFFLKECLSAECVQFDESLSLTKDQKEEILIRLERAVEEQIRQKPLNDKNSLMRDAVLLSSNSPPLTSLTARKRKKKKHSRRRRKEKADINNEAIDQQETRLSFQVPVSDLVTKSKVDDPPPLCQANIDSEKVNIMLLFLLLLFVVFCFFYLPCSLLKLYNMHSLIFIHLRKAGIHV